MSIKNPFDNVINSIVGDNTTDVVNTNKTEEKIINQDKILTENKFDNDVIPTTKTWGIVSSILLGIGTIFNPNGGIIEGILYSLIGIMSTLGLCIVLEGFSTLIKLQRKLTEQNEKILEKMK